MKLNDKTIKATGLILICQYLVKACCITLNKETGVFQKRLKSDIDRLIKNSQFVIKSAKSLENVQAVSKILQKELEMDMVQDNISTECQIFRDIFEIYFTLSPNEVYDLALLLDNFKNKKSLFTEEEVKHAIQKAIKVHSKLQLTQ